MQTRCLYEGPDLLGESPIWHAAEKKLYWVDAIKPALHALDPQSGQHQEWPMPALIGSIAVCKKGGLIAAIGQGFAWIDLPSGKVHMHAIVNEIGAAVHLNDGKCDRLGRFWAGEVCHDKISAQGKLYCLDAQGQVTIKRTDLSLFNGPCWSPCNRFFYYTDSFQKAIYRCDYDLKTGTLGPKHPLIQIPAEDLSTPDGCTVDQEGYLWSAKWNGQRLTRYTPNGEIDQEYALPMHRPTSCIFGGENQGTLFVTSCSQDLGEAVPLHDPYAGQLWALQFEQYRGIAETAFG